VNGDVEIDLLHATIVALFSSPARAVAFISKSLGVDEAALFMCGKLRRERHIELQPSAFPSGALRAYLNPWEVAVECISRGLRVRKDISFTSAVQGPGNLTADELKALSARLMTGTGKRAAAKAGCVLDLVRGSDGVVVLDKLIFSWDVIVGEDPKIDALITQLRPLLLKKPPASVLRSSSPAKSRGMSPSQTESGSPGTAVKPADGVSVTKSTSNKTINKRQVPRGRSKSPRNSLPSPSRASKARKTAAVKTARSKPPVPPSCTCSAERRVGPNSSWLVVEIRRRGRKELVGIGVGVQLPWTLDTIDGRRLAVRYTLTEVPQFTIGEDECSRRQYSLRVMETTGLLDSDECFSGRTPADILQAPSVAAKVRSQDFAGVIDDLMGGTSAASQPEALVRRSHLSAPRASPGGRPSSFAPMQVPSRLGVTTTATLADAMSGVACAPNDASNVTAVAESTHPDAATAVDAVVGGKVPTDNVVEEADDGAYSGPSQPSRLLFNVVDSPVAAPFSLNITFFSPTAITPLGAQRRRFPGRLILFFHVDASTTDGDLC